MRTSTICENPSTTRRSSYAPLTYVLVDPPSQLWVHVQLTALRSLLLLVISIVSIACTLSADAFCFNCLQCLFLMIVWGNWRARSFGTSERYLGNEHTLFIATKGEGEKTTRAQAVHGG
jgi:hypothetical protein